MKRFQNGLLGATALCAAIAASATVGHAAAQAGVAAAVRGDVKIVPAGQTRALPLRSGGTVGPGDRIITAGDSGLQVLLSDETVFSLGPDTRFGLDRYRYDPSNDDGIIKASLQLGSYRVTTGRINEANPGAVSIKMPKGTVQLRGTIVDGETDGETATVFLAGPGSEADTQETKGAFLFIPEGTENADGEVIFEEDTVLVFRAGYALTIDGDGEASEPFELSDLGFKNFGQLVKTVKQARKEGLESLLDGDLSAEELAELLGIEIDEDTDLDALLALLLGEEDAEDATEDSEAAEGDDVSNQPVATVDDVLEFPSATTGTFEVTDVAMNGGGTFTFGFSFDTSNATNPITQLGFTAINLSGVNGSATMTNGSVLADTAQLPVGTTLENISSTIFDQFANNCSATLCIASIDAIRNAGNGAHLKFFEGVKLEATDNTDATIKDSFEGKFVRQGGDNTTSGKLTQQGN